MTVDELVKDLQENCTTCKACFMCVNGKCLHNHYEVIPEGTFQHPWNCSEFLRGSENAYKVCKRRGTNECPGYIPDNTWRASPEEEYCLFCEFASLDELI